MGEDLQSVGGHNGFCKDAGFPNTDIKLIKADLAAEIISILQERCLTGAQAAKLAGVNTADISRIRNNDLSRFTIDRLVIILNRLDRHVKVRITVRGEHTKYIKAVMS